MSYWDTSALGKLYVPEPDSTDFAQKAAADPTLVTAKLALYEMRRVVFRKESGGFIQPGSVEAVLARMDRDIVAGEFRVAELDVRVETEFNRVMATCYRHLPATPVRTFDAIHLATARVAGETEVVTTDQRMRDAAKLLGFTLFPA